MADTTNVGAAAEWQFNHHRILRFIGIGIVLFSGVALLGSTAAMADPITDCREINESGVHTVENNLSSTDSCLNVTANDVHLNGNGYAITGDGGFQDRGIETSGSNTTITDVTVDGFESGIYSSGTDIDITGVTVTNNEEIGLRVRHASDVLVQSVIATGNGADNTFNSGIMVDNVTNGEIRNANLSNNERGLYVRDSTGVIVENITVSMTESMGLYGQSSENITIVDSLITDSSFRGLSLSSSGSTHSLSNVTVTNSSDQEVYISSTVNATDLKVGPDNPRDDGGFLGPEEPNVLSTEGQASGLRVNVTEPASSPNWTSYDDRVDHSLDITTTNPLTVQRPLDIPSYEPIEYTKLRQEQASEWVTLETDVNVTSEVASTTVNTSGVVGIFLPDVVEVDFDLEETVLVEGENTSVASVNATYADGRVENVTDEFISYNTNDSHVVEYVFDGTFQANNSGKTTVMASYDSVTGTVGVAVLEEEPDAVPADFHGMITLNGEPADPGTVIEARLNGETRGSITVQENGTYGGSGALDDRLTVNGTEGEIGDQLTFHIQPAESENLLPGPANQTASFDSGNLTELNLTAALEVPAEPVWTSTLTNDGDFYALGFPGPANGTLGDLFPDGYDGVQTVYTYDDGWQQITDANHTFAPLDVVVVTTSGTGGTIPVEIPLAADTVATNVTLEPGWSLVSGTAQTTAESSFGVEHALVVLDRFEAPPIQGTSADAFESYIIGSPEWGVTAPTVSPFGGYFVYTTGPAEIPVVASDFPYKQAADELLGLES